MSNGWNKKALKVNLSTREINIEPLDNELLYTYLGGRGINVNMLYQLTDNKTDPLGPHNPLIIGTGPLTGTIMPASSRYNITAKSPLTGILGDSNSGGFFASELKYSGFDQIIITGQAEKPVYLKIFDSDIEICDGEDLWGKNVWDVDAILKERYKDNRIQISAIGQAGENLVNIAGIINNLGRAAARTGMGAVMGSKKLKAIVLRGTQGIKIAEQKRFEENVESIMGNIYSAVSYEARATYGTTMLVNIYNAMGVLPYRNCQGSYFEDADKISGETLFTKYITNLKSCFSCPVHCSRYYVVKEGEYAGTKGEGPEFETLSSLGSRCDNSNLESILKMNNLCNQYGLDTISTGDIIAFAMECYEKGLITSKDTDGLDLTWGNHDSMVKLVHKIAYREGFGEILARGVKKASEEIPGSGKYALHVKGMETPAQGIRGLKAWGLAWAVSSRGADHLRAFPLAETTWTEEEAENFFGTKDIVDRFKYKGKAKLIKWAEEYSAITDCLEVCKIPGMGLNISIDSMADTLSAATGVEFSGNELLKCGERILNLERLYNQKHGLDRKDDVLPERFKKEAVPKGNSKGEVIDESIMLDEYYELRGWDINGNPKKEKLDELNIKN